MNHGKSRIFSCFNCIFGFALYCFIGLVYASAPSAPQVWYQVSEGYFSTGLAACQATLPRIRAAYTDPEYSQGITVVSGAYADPNNKNMYCEYRNPVTNAWYSAIGGNAQYRFISLCGNGTLPDTTQPLAQQCSDPVPTCTAGAVETVTFQSAMVKGTGPNVQYQNKQGLPTQSTGCSATVSKVVKCESDAALGGALRPVICTVEMTLTGQVAPPDAPPAPAPATPPTKSAPEATAADVAAGAACPAGTVQTGMDSSGMVSCAGSGTAPGTATKETSSTPPVTTNNADGSTTTTSTSTSKNSDGSSTTITTTTNKGADGKSTTSISSSTGGATGGGAGIEDKKSDDFCTKNPTLAVCVNGSVSGSCGSMQCKGDAIQCAIYLQQSAQYCGIQGDKAVIDGVNMQKLDMSPGTADDVKGINKDGKNDIDIQKKYDAARSDAASKLPMFNTGGGSCPAPMNVQMPITHSAVNIPFDTLCGLASAMRGFVIMAAGLCAMRIMFKMAS